MEPMHPVFTLVPLRSYSAYVKGDPPALDELMCALMVDPLEAEDTVAEMGMEMPHALADFSSLGRRPYTAALQTIAQWAEAQTDAAFAMRMVTLYDRRLGVWCACQLAREVMSFVSPDEKIHKATIELTESWVRGGAEIKKVRSAAKSAISAADYYFNEDAFSYSDVLFASGHAAYVASSRSVAGAVSSAASVAEHVSYVVVDIDSEVEYEFGDDEEDADDAGESDDMRIAKELVRLREVVAAACLTFPL